ncbi:MAG: endoribonuclease YicC domain-containing protein, partial [Thiobacillus sp.]
VRQEVTLHGMRIDIDEEIGRLRAHVGELRRILSGPGPIGKRMDFLLQEFNREANTIGSKAAALDMTHAAIDLKMLVEQIREQTQNIE